MRRKGCQEKNKFHLPSDRKKKKGILAAAKDAQLSLSPSSSQGKKVTDNTFDSHCDIGTATDKESMKTNYIHLPKKWLQKRI